MIPPIVRVTWEDAYSTNEWSAPDEYTPVFLVHSVGYLLRNNKRQLVLAQSRGEQNDAVADLIVIPAGMVREVETLVEGVPDEPAPRGRVRRSVVRGGP